MQLGFQCRQRHLSSKKKSERRLTRKLPATTLPAFSEKPSTGTLARLPNNGDDEEDGRRKHGRTAPAVSVEDETGEPFERDYHLSQTSAAHSRGGTGGKRNIPLPLTTLPSRTIGATARHCYGWGGGTRVSLLGLDFDKDTF
ncbi:uncharacterized protein G2W53_017143 [Senna tora]|uniref:Uncharacterized protein n=1 Tax=Senna tora TaxID=362788 RepID=A0A834WQP8_9FABA|nr:uncharacterized protein G2W53_017143 [Senna tora]